MSSLMQDYVPWLFMCFMEMFVCQILLLQRAMEELEQENAARDDEKVRYLGEKLQPLQLSGLSMDDLQVSGWRLS